jgi:threonine dehydrogenase-like Zn-dependent dehydrogenase
LGDHQADPLRGLLGDFSSGDIDNPMAAFSSLPHVPGHEVVAEVVALGPAASGLEVGQRVVLNPWLTCGPRGIQPPCPPCASGDLSLCWNFTKGDLGPGVHVGVITGAPGAWAERLAAHDSMLIPVPDGAARGAAFFARMAAGLETTLDDSSRWASVGRRIEPDPAWAAAAGLRYERFCELGTGA